jgi:hypothetical protein
MQSCRSLNAKPRLAVHSGKLGMPRIAGRRRNRAIGI